MTTVSNASPLIALARIERLSVLQPLFQTILVPDAVWQEMVIQGVGKRGREEVVRAMQEGWVRQQSVQDQSTGSSQWVVKVPRWVHNSQRTNAQIGLKFVCPVIFSPFSSPA